jgi:hypothetical protein
MTSRQYRHMTLSCVEFKDIPRLMEDGSLRFVGMLWKMLFGI